MSLIIPDYEERQQIKKERMSIIDSIMQIQSADELHILAVMAKSYYSKSFYNLPLALNDFVDLLDLPMLIKMQDLFREEDSDLWANGQIKELLDNAIAQYVGAEEREQKQA